MKINRTVFLGFALLGVCVLAGSRPAAAQNLNYQLEGVTFDDGATASGSFNYNPTTNTFGSFDITTTNGTSDALVGAHYFVPSLYSPAAIFSDTIFDFRDPTAPYNLLVLVSATSVDHVGTFALEPGSPATNDELNNSGEFAPTPRGIVTGSLVVTDASPVPEASSVVSLGLLLAFGMGGVMVAAKRKKISLAA